MPDASTAHFGRLVANTGRVWRRAVDRKLQPFGLTEATWLPLVRIARAAQPMRQKDLAAALALDGSSVVRLIDALAEAGLVTRQEGAEDRRAREIVCTPSGLATVAKVEMMALQVREEALRDLPPTHVAIAMDVLDHVCAVLGNVVEEETA
ncbi:MarR family winged helix-turn-helix transcriptional regulator [Schauerella aestuarii]|uniref:MarR family winged helix-turn-helix transcriptional regulator n=1 Tax=Schauerella aestuarii TaxID=2511204 RepID=UPI00136875CD|nr:MarR family transcriptional regulator [Achromobacter aestuarii]MYZ43878.1 MarR family transcriptional regulator [Achromobacter aestuarii]